ncbi:MAG TPA: zinc ribbon domain-containing protein [Pyrinomonadaceae bacterium]|nr:zinc ribbon domain-containing protein [Pyrinomonadaceae bacterium]
MFCPRCAAQNADDARFCRACGTDISLVPQAVTGQLAQRLSEEGEDDSRRGRKRQRREKRKPTIERAVRELIMGLAFVFVAFAVRDWAPAGHIWWFWMLIPAASGLADGISVLLRLREEKQKLAPPAYTQQPTAMPPAPQRAPVLPPRNTGEIIPPPSVTEGTTRLLDNVPAERPRGER